MARRVAEQPVALVLTFRSDEVTPPLERLLVEIDRTRNAIEVGLRRFSAAQLSTMLGAIFEGAPPGAGFAETIYELTDGNPFFVEEVLKAMVSAGEVARRADGAWHARPLARVQPPRTAVEAVRRRLSALTVPARDVASAAALAGRRFDFTLLQTITGHDERALLTFIRELIAAQLVTEESPDRFAFRHALTREAILGELLARERAALHRSVANALQQLGGAADAQIEPLAYHAYGARDWSWALETSVRAARHALANWTSASFAGQMFDVIAGHVASSPIASSVLRWGDESVVRTLLAAASRVECVRRRVTFDYPASPVETVRRFRECHGPTRCAFDGLNETARGRLEDELVALWADSNRARGSTTRVESEYLDVLAIR